MPLVIKRLDTRRPQAAGETGKDGEIMFVSECDPGCSGGAIHLGNCYLLLGKDSAQRECEAECQLYSESTREDGNQMFPAEDLNNPVL